jgi:hypothetical protein
MWVCGYDDMWVCGYEDGLCGLNLEQICTLIHLYTYDLAKCDVYMCICVYVYMCMCLCVWCAVSTATYRIGAPFRVGQATLLRYAYVCMPVCLYVCMSVCLYVCMSVCLYVCMSVCLYACMSVCLYVCISSVPAPTLLVCLYLLSALSAICIYAYMHICIQRVWVYGCLTQERSPTLLLWVTGGVKLLRRYGYRGRDTSAGSHFSSLWVHVDT